jgi:hypothetical protein
MKTSGRKAKVWKVRMRYGKGYLVVALELSVVLGDLRSDGSHGSE